MQQERLTVGLFATSESGTRLLGRSQDPGLVSAVRERIATERKRELAQIEGPVRLVVPNTRSDEGSRVVPPMELEAPEGGTS